jgi:hypothetical protein
MTIHKKQVQVYEGNGEKPVLPCKMCNGKGVVYIEPIKDTPTTGLCPACLGLRKIGEPLVQ